MNTPDGWLLERRLLNFLRAAREAGFTGAVNDVQGCISACHAIPVFDRLFLKGALRSTVCGSARDWRQFDRFFDQYFRPADAPDDEQPPDVSGVAPPGSSSRDAVLERPAPSGTQHAASAAPGSDVLQQLDLGLIFDPQQMREIDRWIDEFTRRVRRRIQRAPQRSRRGRLHYRESLRRAHATGGEPFNLVFRNRRRRLPHLVVFIDVSQSMTTHARFFLRFAKGLAGAFDRCDVFAFDSELIPLGDLSARREGGDSLLHSGPVWRGGTRIAGSLGTFVSEHARTTLSSRATLLLLSDGYDTAPPDQLSEHLAFIRPRVKRLLWLHPLIARESSPRLDPCIVQARKYIDELMPAHSLAALEDVAARIV